MKENYFITDVETRSKIDLTVVGSRNYFNHPSTDIMYIGWKTKKGTKVKTETFIKPNGSIKYDSLQFILSFYVGLPIVAHNFKFEYYAFSMLIRRGILTGKVAQWFGNIDNYLCTKATAQRFGLGKSSLHDLSVQLKIKNAKLGSGGELIKKYSFPGKTGDFLNITEEDNLKWIEYLEFDILATEEIFNILPSLKDDSEYAAFQFDKKLNQRGIRTDIKNVKKLLSAYNTLIENTTKKAEKFGVEKSGNLTVSSSAGLKRLFNEHYEIKINDVQEKTLNKIYTSTKDKEIKELIEIRRIIQAKAPKKLEKFLTLTDEKGIYYDILNYYGTQPTGRWSGYGVQVHNFPRTVTKDFDGDLKKLLAGENIDIGSMLRALLIPRTGYSFLVGDFSSIELIVLAWAVGCNKILDIIKSGKKVYTEFAKEIYNRPIDKEKDVKEYNTGKQAVLGLGYGMGHKQFITTCDKYSIYLNEPEADRIVRIYRNTFPEVPAFWRGVENACKQAITNKGEKIKHRAFTFLYSGRALRIFLPSGRTLYYFNPKVKPGDFSADIELSGQKIWGGVLTAHIISSLARDILIQAVIKCESNGLNPVLTVHDEIVNEIKTKDLKSAEKKFKEIMTFVPPWCQGLPLSADIGIMKRYGKL